MKCVASEFPHAGEGRFGKIYQVHSIPRAGHQTDVTYGIQSAQFVESQTLVHEVYRHELDRAKPTVDASNKFVYRCPQVLVILNILS